MTTTSAGPHSVARNAALLTLATFAARAFTLALAVVIGRKLGVTDYGRYGFASAIGTIVVPLADLGLTPYIGREVARNRSVGEARAVHLLAVKARLALAALAVAAAGAAFLSGDPGTAEAVVIVLAAMLADGVSTFVFGYFQGRERMTFEAYATASTALARSAGGIVFALTFGALLPVLAWILATSALQLAIALRRFRRATADATADHDAADRTSPWRSIVALGAANLSWLIYLQADSVFLGVAYDEHTVGLYSAAYAITFGLQILPWQVAVAFAPVFARTFATDRRAFAETWHQALRIVLTFALPLSLITSILAGRLLPLVFGPQFRPAATALSILVWSSPVWASNTIVSGALRGAGRDQWLATAAGVGLAVNLAMNAWAIPLFGLNGAAAVTVGTELAVLLAQAGFALSQGVIPRPHLPYARLGAALLACGAMAWLSRSDGAVAAVLASMITYAVAVTALGAVSVSELRRLVLSAADR